MPADPLFRKVDAIEVAVPTVEEGLAFYRDRLGHRLLWRTRESAGLAMPDTDAELVLQAERPEGGVDLLVQSAEAAVEAVLSAGGRLIAAPFDVPIGRCAVVEDPWGNRLVLIDARNGIMRTDADGWVVGVGPDERDDDDGGAQEQPRG